MINASKEFKEKVKKGAYVTNYADITLRDGTVLNLEPKDFMIGGCKVVDKTTDGKFGVGFAIGKTLSIRLANFEEQFSEYDFYKAVIYLYIALVLDDGTVEKIRKGKYYVVKPETPGDIIQISGVDSMYLLDKPYKSNLSYPATLQQILSQCCLDCGINIGFGQFDNYNFVVDEEPEDVTYRQVVSYVTQIAGCNARINNNDALELIWYDRALLDAYNIWGGSYKAHEFENVINGGTYIEHDFETVLSAGTYTDARPEQVTSVKNLNVSTDEITITGIRVVGEETEYLQGEEGYLIEVKDNPLCEGKEKAIAEYLGNRIIGMKFRIFNASVLGNPLYEPFDICMVFDRKENGYISLINSVTYNIGSYTEIACLAESPVRNESHFVSEAAKAIVEARRNTKKQLSAYDKVVQNMNQLAGNALGFHTTYEEQVDGSKITYLHDKPNLSDSKIIYKQTIDGFFISQDGGESYTAGFDANGNAVVNVLYAIGIVADWIKGGTLVLGGDNNVNGVMTVLDSDGNVVGRLDADGLRVENGYFKGAIESQSAKITGGEINIETDSETNNIIILKGGNDTTTFSPRYLKLGYNSDSAYAHMSYTGVTISEGSEVMQLSKEGITGAGSGNSWHMKKSGVNILGLKISAGNAVIGSNESSVGFFGDNGSIRQTVSTVSTPASASAGEVAYKVNEIINTLKGYGLIL